MVIGTNSKITIFEMFQTGIKELVRALGLPAEVRFKAGETEIIARSADFTRRIDQFRIIFPTKENANPEELREQLNAKKIPSQIVTKNGRMQIALPAFEWRHLQHLEPADRCIQDVCAEPLRCRSWVADVSEFIKTDFNINVLVEEMRNRDASDLHLRAGSPPFLRVDGGLKPMDMPPLSKDDMERVLFMLGGELEVEKLDAERENSFQYHLAGVGYLRCSGYIKMGAMSLAIRFIPEEPVPFDKLNLPDVIRKLALGKRGLFLVCGVTGSGKSTTLAAMVDYINECRSDHIITTEDPIEFVYTDKKSIISQRQVGRDTFSFANALRGALREDPDVILVGEMRDQETIRAAISAASTGHMVLSTLHTMTAVDTVNRIISYFPQAERDVIRQELAYTLQGVCCQRLLKRKGGGRIPCIELLLGGIPMVRDAILEGDIQRLTNIIEVDPVMKSFDQYAVDLYKKGLVTKEEAISACSDEEAFIRVTTGIKGTEGRKLLK